MEMQTLPTPNTETIQPMTPPGSSTVSGSAGNIVSGNGSDSITCGQCSLKFFHVTQFLKHKSSCPGNSSEDSKIDGKKKFSTLKNVFDGKYNLMLFWYQIDNDIHRISITNRNIVLALTYSYMDIRMSYNK